MTAVVRQTASSVSGLAHLSSASHLTQGAAVCPSSRIFPSVQGSRSRQQSARSVTVRAADGESEGEQTEVRTGTGSMCWRDMESGGTCAHNLVPRFRLHYVLHVHR